MNTSNDIRLLGLSTRAYNLLVRAGIERIQDLKLKSATELWLLKGSGDKTVIEIKTKLDQYLLSGPKEDITTQAIANVDSQQPANKDSFQRVPIDGLSLSPRVFNALNRAGYKTLGHVSVLLDGLANNGQVGVRNLGSKGLRELQEAVRAYIARPLPSEAQKQEQAQSGKSNSRPDGIKLIAKKGYLEVLDLRLGLKGNSTHTLQEVAENRGVTRERVRQIQSWSLRWLARSELVKGALRELGGAASHDSAAGPFATFQQLAGSYGYAPSDVIRLLNAAKAAAMPLEDDAYKEFLKTLQINLIDRLRALYPDVLPDNRGRDFRIALPHMQGTFYEFKLGRQSHEVRLVFKSTLRRNRKRVQAFETILADLGQQIGQPLRIFDDVGHGHIHLVIDLGLNRPTPIMASGYAEIMNRFISVTYPILQTVYLAEDAGRQRISHSAVDIANLDPTISRAYAILQSELGVLEAYRKGFSGRTRSSEKLCDWVQLCYTFGLYTEGRDLFAMASRTDTNDWYYQRAQKIAAICALKIDSHV